MATKPRIENEIQALNLCQHTTKFRLHKYQSLYIYALAITIAHGSPAGSPSKETQKSCHLNLMSQAWHDSDSSMDSMNTSSMICPLG